MRRLSSGATAMVAEAARVAVLDASALAALLFGEPDGERVEAALRGARPVAPSLIRFEVGNVCLTKLRLHPGERARLMAALRLLDRMDLRTVEVDPGEVVVLAEAESLTFYDAACLWLAVVLGAPLVTLDRRLGEAAQRVLGRRRGPRQEKRRR